VSLGIEKKERREDGVGGRDGVFQEREPNLVRPGKNEYLFSIKRKGLRLLD